MTQGPGHTHSGTDDAAQGLRRLAVLLVALPAALRQRLVDMLAQGGFALDQRHAGNLPQLEQALQEGDWDLIISADQAQETAADAIDAIDAPDALAILARVRRLAPHLPLIIAAESLSDQRAIAAMRAGANDYLDVERHLERLLPIVQRELRSAQLSRQEAQAQQRTQLAMRAQLQAATRFQRLTEVIPECVWVLDLDERRMTFVSAAYERIWGRSVQDLLDDRLDWLRHIHPDDQERMRWARNHARQGGLDEEFRVIRPDGDIRWLHLTTFPIHDAHGRMQSIGGVASDISSFIEQREQLRANLLEQRHRAEVQRHILDALPADLALLDERGDIIEVNAAWLAHAQDLNATEYVIGNNYPTLVERMVVTASDEAVKKTTQELLAETRHILAGGERASSHIFPIPGLHGERWYRVNVAPLHTNSRRGAVVMIIEITESMLAEQRMLQLTQYDSLTNLPNRLLFRDRLGTTLARARRTRTLVAVCFLDLDRFKAVNESLGHGTGDRLLLEISRRLSGCIRDCDTVARLGGDEFALLLPELVDQQDSAIVAERIIQALNQPVVIDDNELFITASIGITLFPDDGSDADTLLRNADTAMARAKETGRNGYQFYTAQMNASALAALNMERDLRHALDNREFLLHYQPKVSLKSGQITGFEALLRWQHPSRGMVSPMEFVPLLEETGLIVPVGAWVLQAACQQAQAWHAAGLGTPSIAVNVSGRQLHQELALAVANALSQSGLPAQYLELELTESYLMQDAENIISTLHSLKRQGIHISVDDFGTGYSSLAYLKRFPLDTLKVDRAFVQDITADPNDVSITRAIITLAHSFNLKVVAEGVETEGQLNLLIANQCDIMQGYYFSRPLPASDAGQLLRDARQLPQHVLQHAISDRRNLLLAGLPGELVTELRQCLVGEDHDVQEADNAKQAYELMARQHIDLLVIGEQLTGLPVAEFIQRTHDLYPDSLRVYLGQQAPDAGISACLMQGLLHKLLVMPLARETFCASLKDLLRQLNLHQENHQLQQLASTAHRELAEVNAQLKKQLVLREQQVQHHATLLGTSHEIFQQLPWPLLGIDPGGLIAMANQAATTLFAGHGTLLGSQARHILPAELYACLDEAPGINQFIKLDELIYRVHLQAMGTHSAASGQLLILYPV